MKIIFIECMFTLNFKCLDVYRSQFVMAAILPNITYVLLYSVGTYFSLVIFFYINNFMNIWQKQINNVFRIRCEYYLNHIL